MLLSTGQCATLACILEATAPKPGNVHRGADFEDLTYLDLILSGTAIGPAMDGAADNALGETILQAVRATRQVVATNSNLGMILLLAPLAAVPRDVDLIEGVPQVLQRLSSSDAQLVYEAIRLARPGGLGKVAQADVAESPPEDLLAAMRLAAERDLVARQYAEGFQEVLRFVVPELHAGLRRGWSLSQVIVRTYLAVMREFPDSLIARKCGPEVAQRSAAWAGAAIGAGPPGSEAYLQVCADLDFWLRSDGHRRNPGTSADLIAAGVFACLRDGVIRPPFSFTPAI